MEFGLMPLKLIPMTVPIVPQDCGDIYMMCGYLNMICYKYGKYEHDA